MNRHPTRRATRGFALAEVLVAMALGLMLVAAALSMLIATQRTNAALDAISRLQEAGRFALYIMERDVRMAGYRGCAQVMQVHHLTRVPGTADAVALYDFNQPYFGWSEAAVTPPTGRFSASFANNYARGDVLLVKSAAEPAGFSLAANVVRNSHFISITPAQVPPYGQLLMVSNCAGNADVFQVSNRSTQAETMLYRREFELPITPGNLNPDSEPFSTSFAVGAADLTLVQSNLYYVGFGTDADGNRSTDTGLRRIQFGRAAAPPDQELVGSVYDMRVQYGLDQSGDGKPDLYRAMADMSGADWEQVVSLRIGILAYSGDDATANAAEAVAPVPFDPTLWQFAEARVLVNPEGEDAPPLFLPPDLRLYRFFSTTIANRGRVQ